MSAMRRHASYTDRWASSRKNNKMNTEMNLKFNNLLGTKKTIVMLIALAIPVIVDCQIDIEKIYYKNVYKIKPLKNEKKAKFVEIIKREGDSLKTIEFIRLKDDKIFESVSYKNGVPYGEWKLYNKNKKKYKELNYSFDTKYSKEHLKNVVFFDLANQEVEEGIKPEDEFSPPTLKDGLSINEKIYQSIWYPKYARNNGIDGIVKVLVKIDKEGQLSVMSIYQNAEPHLDAESIRVINKCQNWNPATLNGEKIDIYSILSVTFKLE